MKSLLGVIADSNFRLLEAEGKIWDRLFSLPWFCYKYQLHRLKNLMPEQVGADLSGSAVGGIVKYPPSVAADMLCSYARNQCLWVTRPRDDLPYTEGNLSFDLFRKSRLPASRPVLFYGKEVITVDQFAKQQQVTLAEAAHKIIDIVENE